MARGGGPTVAVTRTRSPTIAVSFSRRADRAPVTRLDRARRAFAGGGLDRFHGRIAAAGFASGEQTVVGAWHASPLGSFADVMWVRPDGHRVLLAPSHGVAAYVGSLYAFDEVRVVEVSGTATAAGLDVHAGPVRVSLTAGPRTWRSWVFAARPRPLRRSPAWIGVEDRLVGPLGTVLLGGAPGVRLAGDTPGGRREWYSIDDHRPLVDGRVEVDGADGGTLTSLRPGLGVGLSDFPSAPAIVTLTTLIEPAPAGAD